MNIVLIKRFNTYLYVNAATLSASTLVHFLTSDVESEADWWKELVLRGGASISGNTSFVYVHDDNVIISDLYIEKEDEKRAALFTLSKIEYIELLDQWDALYNQKPDKIIVTISAQGKVSFDVDVKKQSYYSPLRWLVNKFLNS